MLVHACTRCAAKTPALASRPPLPHLSDLAPTPPCRACAAPADPFNWPGGPGQGRTELDALASMEAHRETAVALWLWRGGRSALAMMRAVEYDAGLTLNWDIIFDNMAFLTREP